MVRLAWSAQSRRGGRTAGAGGAARRRRLDHSQPACSAVPPRFSLNLVERECGWCAHARRCRPTRLGNDCAHQTLDRYATSCLHRQEGNLNNAVNIDENASLSSIKSSMFVYRVFVFISANPMIFLW
ncbi:hypothetical protein B5X24_HaOG202022 [Helicoverpa armigera]|uniref:Uncharacterized protein n=1 Tax=Helicoverpa armigera TaxID=29058 RepID=A0A2W1C330_HELAM|nr:hypothetical protein B5X24_HaOG202022 [Helicoverpa armigera]